MKIVAKLVAELDAATQAHHHAALAARRANTALLVLMRRTNIEIEEATNLAENATKTAQYAEAAAQEALDAWVDGMEQRG